MNSKTTSLIALLLAILAVGLEIENRILLHKRVAAIVEQREGTHAAQLAIKLNEARELMGLQPVSPKNFAEVLTSYFESMATIMDAGISNRRRP